MIKPLSAALVALCLNHALAGFPGSYYANQAKAAKKGGGATSYSQYINYHEPAPYKEYDDEPAAPAKMAEAAGEGQPMEAAAMMMAAEGAGEQGNQGGGKNRGVMGGEGAGGKNYRGGQKYRGGYSYMSQENGKGSGGGGEAVGMQEDMLVRMTEGMPEGMRELMPGGMQAGMAMGNAEMMPGGEANSMEGGNQGGNQGSGEAQAVSQEGSGGEGRGEEEGEGIEPEYLYVLHAVASPIKLGYGLKTEFGKKLIGGLQFGYRGRGRPYSMRKEEGGGGAGGEQGGAAMVAAMGGENGGMEMMQGGAGGMVAEGQEEMMEGSRMMAERGGMGMSTQMGRGRYGYYMRRPGGMMGGNRGMAQMEGGMAQNEGGGMMQMQQRMEEMGGGASQMQGGVMEEQGEMMSENGEEDMTAEAGASGAFGGKNGGHGGGFDLTLGQAGMGEFKREFYAPAYYLFRYGVEDYKTGDFKKHHEVRDKDGTRGFYSLVEPDGTVRVVRYRANKNSGFNAVVETRGRSKHPSSR